MTAHTRHRDSYTLSTHRLSAEARIDDEGYLHTGRSQRHADRIVVSCGRTEGQQ
ncbi:hypothetical protein [Halohasta litorea]|uniref:Uncharacterized protein n=1 Tax=Halohasta litorea TaxID=869891 RepID=A0ABD6D938_9EURY|nr:hypothetical protein [Halohasta litorea]